MTYVNIFYNVLIKISVENYVNFKDIVNNFELVCH